MRPISLFTTTALLAAACIDEPIRPDIDEAVTVDPMLAVVAVRSTGTIEFPPLPGANDVFVQGVNASGDAVGRSGDRPARWEMTGSSDEPLESSTSYDFQLMSYRRRSDGTWSGAVYSNIGIGQTSH